MNLTLPFLGVEAVAAGAVTRGCLAGPAFRHLGHGVYVDVRTPVTLEIRARAAALSVLGSVVGGYAAAELLDASCAPHDASGDLIVRPRRLRRRPGVVLRQDVLGRGDDVLVDEVRVTTPLRTAYDLARRLPHVEAVVAVDALAHRWRFDPDELLRHPAARPNPRDARRLVPVLADVDPRAGSPPETRVRLLLLGSDLPRPEPQCAVLDARGRFVGRLDFGWPRWKIGLEYQGEDHWLDRERYAADAVRFARLAAAGWLVLPVTAADLHHTSVLTTRVRDALSTRGLQAS